MLEITFKNPYVRDLAWAMLSPALIKSLNPEPNSSSSLQGRELFISDEHCSATFAAHKQWLLGLDNDPQPLIEYLSVRKSGRLGYYFEDLVAYWIQERISENYFDAHLKISGMNGQDIGEFDFLFRSSGKFVHWETAVKFYLYCCDKAGNINWYGPNARDTLKKKLQRMTDHQVRLSEVPEAVSMLSNRGIKETNLSAHIFLKGYLFYPLGEDLTKVNFSVAGCLVSPGHLRGHWVSVDVLGDAVSSLGSQNDQLLWAELSKQEWLASRIFAAIHGKELLLSEFQIVQRLSQQFKHSNRSRLIAGYAENEYGQWQETTRLFVVASSWPDVI